MPALKLSALEGKIVSMVYAAPDKSIEAVMFRCPCHGHDHYHIIPFSDIEPHEIKVDEDKKILVWKRTGGNFIHNISLEPVFEHPGCGLSGTVINGSWYASMMDSTFEC